MCLWASFIPDRPLHHAGEPVQSFIPGDLVVLPRVGSWQPLVLEAGVHPILNRLHQQLTEGQGHHEVCQPLSRQAGDLVEDERRLDQLLLDRRLFPARAIL